MIAFPIAGGLPIEAVPVVVAPEIRGGKIVAGAKTAYFGSAFDGAKNRPKIAL
jgi:hypothetical protein